MILVKLSSVLVSLRAAVLSNGLNGALGAEMTLGRTGRAALTIILGGRVGGRGFLIIGRLTGATVIGFLGGGGLATTGSCASI